MKTSDKKLKRITEYMMLMKTKGVEWKNIPDIEGYYVGDNGQVVSMLSGRILRPRSSRKYRPYVNIKGLGETPVNELVWTLFVGPVFKGQVIYHEDNDLYNCSVSNLQLINDVPYWYNLKQITEEEVESVREMMINGFKYEQINQKYPHISKRCIYLILNTNLWFEANNLKKIEK